VEESKLKEIEDAVQGTLNVGSPFGMRINRFGGFPNLGNPRVLFIGLSQNEGLSELQKGVEKKLGELGFEKENRPFQPHVTVGRIKKKPRLKDSLPVPESISFSISEVAVMRSMLRPEGSKYAPISVSRLVK
jgi:2''-5'' RNA ligase